MKKINYIIAIVGVLYLISCKEEEVPNLAYVAPEVNLSFTPQMAAVYKYNHDSLESTINTYRSPSSGKYVSLTDFDIVEQQIEACKDAGIGVWIMNWGESSTNDSDFSVTYRIDEAVETFLTNVPSFASDIQYMMRYTVNHDLEDSADVAEMELILKDFIDNHINRSPNYYQIDGKPVIMFNEGNMDPEQPPTDDPIRDPRVSVLNSLKNELEQYAGTELYFILDVVGFNPPQRYYDLGRWFDAVGATSITSGQFSIDVRFNLALEETFVNWKNWMSADTIGTSVIPLATLGRNDTTTFIVVQSDGQPDTITNDSWVHNNTPETFRETVKISKFIVSEELPLIIVDSWNNFSYGSAIEPSNEEGEVYLDILKEEIQ